MKAQTSLRISTFSSELSLLSYTKYGNRGRLRPKMGCLSPLDMPAWEFKGGVCEYVVCGKNSRVLTHLISLYSKCSKIANNFLILFSNKTLVFRAGRSSQILVCAVHLVCFGRQQVFKNFRTFTVVTIN